jgi:NRAMP (natural resistance-associated macrophage protein)-like metal ion transporter
LTATSRRKKKGKEAEEEAGKEDSLNYNNNNNNNNEVHHKPSLTSRLLPKTVFKSLGPGIITGAADDDPSGIATFSQAGAQFGFGMLWMALFQYPMMTIIQEMCARIGLVTGKGLAGVLKKKYSKRIILPLAGLLLIANTINIGADIAAMGASVRLLIPQIPILISTLCFALFIIGSEIIIPYKQYAKVLKYTTLSLFSYIITAIIVGGNWNQIAVSSILPHIEFKPEFAMIFVAIIGTSISPYLFFWQTSEEAEEDVSKHKIKEIGKGTPAVSQKEIKLMRIDIAAGIAFAELIVWAIMITTAGSLHSNGITDIKTAEQAAKALEPLVKSFPFAGEISKAIFAFGIIGTGLLAVPVLAGSSGYALADTFGWEQGLHKKFKQAKVFYLVIGASTLIGLLMNLIHIDPFKALLYAAIINGITAVPILFAVMKMSNDKKLLRGHTNGKISNIIGWLTFAIMAISVVTTIVTWINGYG